MSDKINKWSHNTNEISQIFKDLLDDYESLKEENEKLKLIIEKQNEAYSLMCSEKTRRYNELNLEYEKLQAKERYDVIWNKDEKQGESDYLEFQKAHKI